MHHLGRRDADHCQRPFPKLRIPTLISAAVLRVIVRGSVHLDDQSRFTAEEIYHVRLDWMLPSEFQAARPLPKLLPQHDLRQRHLAAEPASGVNNRTLQLRRAPFTALRTVPLPVPGRIRTALLHPSSLSFTT